MGLPNIVIEFTKAASTAITRSSRGIVLLALDDTTSSGDALATYKDISQVSSKNYTAENYREIEDAFRNGAIKVFAIKIGGTKYTDFSAATADIDTLSFNWMCYPNAEKQADVVTYVKTRNTANPNKQIKAVVQSTTGPDDMHIVNFVNTAVTRKDASSSITGVQYMPRITGLLAALPMTRTATYFILDDIDSVTEVADPGAAVDAGKFCIINDYGEPKIARGVDSLTTVGETMSDSMKKITIVESIDLMKEDISSMFKSGYVGKYKNNLDNQNIFIGAVNQYFATLSNVDNEVLDNEYDNEAAIDVEAQRSAWIASGESDAADWNDAKVKKMSYSSYMYLGGNVKILDGIEDLTFKMNLAY